ncbi:MAG: hypothetical protein QOD12_537 [Verrucomicrobiota bacterium]|jgi:hypothetical protein
MGAASPSRPNRAAERSIHQFFLGAFHFRRAAVILIVKAVQMKETMRDVQTQFVFKRCPEGARLALRCFCADHDLTMLERDDVRRARFIKEATVKRCYPSIRYQDNVDFAQLREAAISSCSKLQAFRQGHFCECLQRIQANRHGALPIPNRY